VGKVGARHKDPSFFLIIPQTLKKGKHKKILTEEIDFDKIRLNNYLIVT